MTTVSELPDLCDHRLHTAAGAAPDCDRDSGLRSQTILPDRSQRPTARKLTMNAAPNRASDRTPRGRSRCHGRKPGATPRFLGLELATAGAC